MRSEFLGALRRTGGLDPSRRPFGGRIGRLGAALGLAAFVALSAGVAAAASQVSPPDGSPKFLRLPFSDPGVAHGQGWYYPSTATVPPVTCPYPSGDLPGWKTHCGHDYRKIVNRRHQTFEVLAAASGRAQRFSTTGGAGHYVVVEHDQRAPNGEMICTRYLHLDPTRIVVPTGRWTTVAAGQRLAWAGKTGTSTIHLHFDVRIGDCAAPYPRVDPYDIAGALIGRRQAPTKEYYPGYSRFTGCGPNSLWVHCPPGQ